MNWLLVVVLVILAGHTIKGYRRGFLRVLFSVASLLITVLFVAWATPYVSNFLKENTKIYQKVETKCEQKVRKDTKEQIVQKEEKSTGLLEEYGIRLPKSIEEKLFGNVEKGADGVLETSGVYKAMAEPLAQLAVDGIAFFVSLIVCAISSTPPIRCSMIAHLIGGVLDIASELPVIKGINQVLGLGAGLLYGLLLVWLFFYFVAVMQAFPFGQSLLAMIQQSEFLTALYEDNMVAYVVQYVL